MAQAVTGLVIDVKRWSDVAAAAQRADDEGFASLWLHDRGAPTATLAALAQIYRGRLGLIVDPRRRTLSVLAKELASLDVISDGRLEVAVELDGGDGGAGDDALEVFSAMWSDAPATYDGATIALEVARCLPPPRQRPRPPVWVAAGEPPEGRRRELSDGWLAVAPTGGAGLGGLAEAAGAYRAGGEGRVGLITPPGRPISAPGLDLVLVEG